LERRDPTTTGENRPISETPIGGDRPFDPATDAFRPDAADPTLPVTDEEIDEVVVEEEQVDEVEASRIEIEQTRAEMSETVDAIQARLSPESLKEQAKDTVKEATVGRAERAVSDAGDAAKEAGSGLVDTIRENPIPAALTGLGLGWLLMSSRQQSSSSRPRYRYETYPYDYPPRYGESRLEGSESSSGGVASRAQDRAGEAVSRVQDTAGEVASQAQERASQLGEGAKQTGSSLVDSIRENPVPAALTGLGLGWLLMSSRQRSSGQTRVHARTYDYSTSGYEGSGGSSTGQAQERAGQVAGQAQEKVGQVTDQAQQGAARLRSEAQQGVQRASGSLQRMLHENPLAVGALGVGTGVALGLAIPETGKEHEVMGEARDNLVQKGQEKVQETQQKVKQVAEEAQSAAKQEAEDQGLSSGS
jgi:ElaB/YqjD/DUF883 family membrane-anchored ribosome-binding protein